MNNTYPAQTSIVHVDGDAFFASCEQATHPEWKGKIVVTGKERGIVSSVSYEGKRLGISRAMSLYEVKQKFPQAIIVASDYETYSLISKRMFNIMRRYSNLVEEYGIDEGFVDLSGLRRPMHMSYEKMAIGMKTDIEKELGITVSVGLAPTKVLAKAASKWKKPSGLTVIRRSEIHQYLKKLPVIQVWGIGSNTAGHMNNFGIHTAFDFISKDREFVGREFTRPHQELWLELQGVRVYAVNPEEKTSYASISKNRTFTPASADKDFIFSQLIKNVENACIKARRYNLVSKRLYIYLKTQNFQQHGLEICLNRASAYPNDLTPVIKPLFEQLYTKNVQYRATGLVLSDLQENTSIQGTLFESPITLTKMQRVFESVDALAAKFGKHTVYTGASMKANTFDRFLGDRGDVVQRKQRLFTGETLRKRLNIPMFLGTLRS